MRLGIAIPNNDDFTAETVTTLSMISFYAGRNNYDFTFLNCQGCCVDKNRNTAVDLALKNNCDYLLFLDTDTHCFDGEDVVQKLINHNVDVISGVVYHGNEPHVPSIWEWTDNGKVKNITTVPFKLFPIQCAGGAFMLIKRSVLEKFTPEVRKRLGEPFDYLFEENQLRFREDFAFFWRLKQLGVQAYADGSIRLGHVKKRSISDMDWISNKILGKIGT